MSYRILVVKSEQDFVTSFIALATDYKDNLQVTYVPGRKEALQELKSTVFDKIVTALKIPRASDGYLFLSHVAKTLSKEKLIVVADERSDEVVRSIHVMGVQQLYSAKNVKGIFQELLVAAGLLGARSKGGEVKEVNLPTVSQDKIRNALNWVMGPVGSMIFEEALSKVDDQNDSNALIKLIEDEIREESKIVIFHDQLRK